MQRLNSRTEDFKAIDRQAQAHSRSQAATSGEAIRQTHTQVTKSEQSRSPNELWRNTLPNGNKTTGKRGLKPMSAVWSSELTRAVDEEVRSQEKCSKWTAPWMTISHPVPGGFFLLKDKSGTSVSSSVSYKHCGTIEKQQENPDVAVELQDSEDSKAVDKQAQAQPRSQATELANKQTSTSGEAIRRTQTEVTRLEQSRSPTELWRNTLSN